MPEEKKKYDDPGNWEYDGGSENWTGDPNNLSPAMKAISDQLTAAALPEGKEAYQKQRTAKINRFHEAIIFAARKHAGQMRKGTDIPYISHPMEVMQILLTENNCSEDVIISGILHDVIEDTGTAPEEILGRFGENVLKIIAAESEDKSKTWKERKQATIDHLAGASLDVKLVCCADKLSNLRSMAADKEDVGDKLWERFNAGKSDIEWYYRGIAAALPELADYKMYRELTALNNEVFK